MLQDWLRDYYLLSVLILNMKIKLQQMRNLLNVTIINRIKIIQ